VVIFKCSLLCGCGWRVNYEKFEDPKGYPEVIRSCKSNTKAKQTIYKILHRKLKTKQHEPH